MYGIRKTVITNSAVFVLDNSGSVHKWDSDDEFWSPNVLERDHNLSSYSVEPRYLSSLEIKCTNDFDPGKVECS